MAETERAAYREAKRLAWCAGSLGLDTGVNSVPYGGPGCAMSGRELDGLFERFGPTLVGRLSRLCPWGELAEDAAAESWRILCERGCPHSEVEAWLTLVARRELFRLAARRRREVAAAAELGVADPVAVQVAAREALRAVAGLRPRQRHALSRQVAGLTYREIAAESAVTWTHVNRHITEGRAALREAVAA